MSQSSSLRRANVGQKFGGQTYGGQTWRLEQDRAAAHLAVQLVSYAFGVPASCIEADTRGSPEAAAARHMAMYLLHVALGFSLARVALAFGRDRSTASYACRLVEERRDNAEIDSLIAALEAALREAPPPGRRVALGERRS